MPRRSLFLVTLVLAAVPVQAQERDDPDKAITRVLEVQNGLYLGRQHLNKGEAKEAVAALEARLPYINGNRDYLATLRDAYWAYLKELQRTQQQDEINRVLSRLRLLDPDAKLDSQAGPLALPPFGANGKPDVKARAQSEENDPFQQTPLADKQPAAGLARQAKAAFDQRKFAEAERLFEQASSADAAAVKLYRDDWAFCILTRCGDKLNHMNADDSAGLNAIKREVELSLAMGISKPKVQEFGQAILSKVQEFRATTPTDGGAVVESKNFRLHHQQAGELVGQVLQQAEKARTDAIQKWFGGDNTPWAVRCEIYLHANSEQYVKATKGLPQAHGHTTLEVRDGKPTGRRIDLVADNPNLLPAALPREVTHVVLADIFSAPLLPRWADEAMGVLAEPRTNVERYLRVLPRCRRQGQLYAVGPLLQSTDFPDPAGITAFYAESVSLVDMLVNAGGPKKFAVYLQDARRYGYEKALERNYNIRTFAELQDQWQRYVFAAGAK